LIQDTPGYTWSTQDSDLSRVCMRLCFIQGL
jgi:hypothetical protein